MDGINTTLKKVDKVNIALSLVKNSYRETKGEK